jgi:acetyltransferase-like isoleucine patch superfamily enzyme
MIRVYFYLKRNLEKYNVKLYWYLLSKRYTNRLIFQGEFLNTKAYIQLDLSKSRITIGNNVVIRRFLTFLCLNNGEIKIGSNTFFNNSCSINCMESITIGNDCQFGENVKMYDHNHAYKNKALPINQQGYVSGAITIGNNCWIGSNVTILRNVQIGNNVVVGAGCVVAKSIPDNTVVVHQQNLHSFSY